MATSKLPDGTKLLAKVVQDRNTIDRAKYQHRFSPEGVIEQLFRDGVPAVYIAYGDDKSEIIYNDPNKIKSNQMYVVVDIKSDGFFVDSISDEEFNTLASAWIDSKDH
ncbi:hypothetical protein ACJMK2_029355 [Sinanodonta woodiana]|uniref:Uncharacterized protein n=1 Tax=Sinanodonta woodiana TaxID=1069815 RepID=A0ABD3XAF8_SINWO